MKTLKQTTCFFLIAVIGFAQTGCFGRFSLTNKMYSWNKTVGNKFVNSLVFWVFIIIPVYEVVFLVDFVVLNLIDFWSGKNPVAMKAGEKETQMVAWRGEQYQITATQNRFHIEQLTGKKKGKVTELVYCPEDKSWSAVAEGQTFKLVSFTENKDHQELVTFYKPDGSTLTTSTSESVTSIQRQLSETYAHK